jgi:hypothetical protein
MMIGQSSSSSTSQRTQGTNSKEASSSVTVFFSKVASRAGIDRNSASRPQDEFALYDHPLQQSSPGLSIRGNEHVRGSALA